MWQFVVSCKLGMCKDYWNQICRNWSDTGNAFKQAALISTKTGLIVYCEGDLYKGISNIGQEK